MTFNVLGKWVAATLSLLICTHAFGADTAACMLEGKLPVGTKLVEAKDCVEKSDARMSEEMLSQTCQALGEIGKSLGGEPAKITKLAKCPSGAQGVCAHVQEGPMSIYYYKRSPSDLKETKESCLAMGGTWK
jgi:hypothetical protein